MTGNLVALDKFPGVKPVVIGEVYRRHQKKLILRAGRYQAKEARKRGNLCSNLKAGIEGVIHVLRGW